MFCGTGGMSAAFQRQGLKYGLTYDINLSPLHDLTSPSGLAMYILDMLELVPLAHAVIALPCSTFVFLSRGTSKRTLSNAWLGDPLRDDVNAANLISKYVILLCKIMTLRLVQWFIEQPLTSCFFSLAMFTRLKELNPFIQASRSMQFRLTLRFAWLGAFGHTVAKPTVLWGCSRVLLDLKTQKPKSLVKVTIVKSTTLKCILRRNKWVQVFRLYGGRKNSKSTQQSPRAFCEYVARDVADLLKTLRFLRV